MTTKTIVNISSVFKQMSPSTVIGDIVNVDNVDVRINKNLLYMYKLHVTRNHELQCSECGCMPTHIQKFSIPNVNVKTQERFIDEVWRLMVWNKEKQCQSFLNLDHVIAKKYGGKYTLNNLRITCHECNCARGHKIINASGSTSEQEFKVAQAHKKLDRILVYLSNKFKKEDKKIKKRIVNCKCYLRARIRENPGLFFDSNQKRALIEKTLTINGFKYDSSLINYLLMF